MLLSISKGTLVVSGSKDKSDVFFCSTIRFISRSPLVLNTLDVCTLNAIYRCNLDIAKYRVCTCLIISNMKKTPM